MSCYFVATDQPRMIRDRHGDECPGEDQCRGCQPCPQPHCRVCNHDHAENACPTCLGDTREALDDIARMCRSLPAEVLHKGVESEAMNLLGPVADPEQTGHVLASIRVHRLPADWLEVADNELHPLIVLGTWQEAYCEAFEHDEPARITVASAASYLGRNLSYAAEWAEIPFEDLARDLRACRTHLERVLHDGEQVETGAPCMTCRRPLLRVFAGNELPWAYRDGSRPRAANDVWACPRCKEWRSENDYRLNVADLHRDKADWLTDQEMEIRTGVRAGTVREWARDRDDRPALVGKRRDSGRTVYAVADVKRVATEKGMLAS